MFQIVGRSHRGAPLYLRMLGKGLQLLEKCSLFSDFWYGFRSSQSTADLLTVASDRIARVFNRSVATRAVAFNISKAFDRVWHASLLAQI